MTRTARTPASRLVALTEYFQPADIRRQQEMRDALSANLANPAIDELHLFCEHGTDLPEWVQGDSLIKHTPATRMSFRTFLEFATDPDCAYILGNLDIELGPDIGRCRMLPEREMWALTRWEGAEPPDYLGRASQDTWVVRGGSYPQAILDGCNFPLGLPGCDNAFAGRMVEFGWKVLNPCYSIRTWHHHASMVRTYLPEERIPRPYFHPDPQGLELSLRLSTLRGRAILILILSFLVSVIVCRKSSTVRKHEA